MTIPSEYVRILLDHGAPGFSPSELVQFNGAAQVRKAMPPRRLWANIGGALDIANILRTAMISRGATCLIVRAAYRANGGAKNSAHKYNAALDLDLHAGDVKRVLAATGEDLRLAFAEEATRLWCNLGRPLEMGLGLYGPAGRDWTWRVHVDTRGCRTWQHAGSRIVRPPAALRIAARLRLALPNTDDTPDEDT